MSTKHGRRTLQALLSTLVAAGAVLPATAGAATETASVVNGTLSVSAAPGVAKSVTVDGFDAPHYNVSGNDIAAGSGCTSDSATLVRCPKPGTLRIQVTLGDGNDRVTIQDTSVDPQTLYGGTGNDQLSGGGAVDRINGGPGTDRFRGFAGNDVFLARDGVRDSFFECDSGFDTIYADRLDPGLYMIRCERIFRPRHRRASSGRPSVAMNRRRSAALLALVASTAIAGCGW